MPEYAYIVIATLPDESTASEYLHWLVSEHLDDVRRAGARSARAVRLRDPSSPIQIEAQYTFGSRSDYDAYIASAAPALRAKGLERFPPARGITFVRRAGDLHSPAHA